MRNICIFISLLLISACNEEHDVQTQRSIEAIANAYIEQNDYVGLAIAAIKGDELVFQEEFGYVDLTQKDAFSAHDVISLGSNAKTATAASILLLQEKGLLKISDSLNKYLPYNIKYGEDVTLREMLCHSSDLPDVFGNGEFEEYRWQNAKSQKELIDKINSATQPVTPGNLYRYNNTAYFLLGLVVEHVSHQSLGDFYREHIFNDNSQNIYYLGDAYYSPQLAPSFEKDGSSVIPYESPVEYRIVGGAGALGGDLISYLQLFQSLVSTDILNEQSQAEMLSTCQFNDGAHIVNGKNQKMGLGVEIAQINGETVYSRGGALNGYVSAVYHFPARNLTVGIIGNTWAPLAPLLESTFETGWLDEL